jgi:phosphoglycolate phosphatase
MAGPLLFDLDGTLTGPSRGFGRSIRYALDRLGFPCPPDDALASFIGPPLRGTFATLLGTADRGQVERAMALYRERYAAVGLYENEVYAGVAEMLETVRGQASALFVATSKPAVYAARIVKHFGLDRYFAGVYGAELGGRFDEKADLLRHLLATEGLRGEGTIMVGDRAADVIAAKANGIRAVAILWGYGSEAELIDAGAETLCSAPAQLARYLAEIARPGRGGSGGRRGPSGD